MSANAHVQPTPSGRSGSNKRQRNGAVLVRLLPEERAAIEARAREAGLSLAAFLRAAALGTPGPRARRSPHVNAEALGRATAALNKVGSNLNQMARGLNAGFTPVAQDCIAALFEVRAAAALIREIVGRKDRL